VDVERIAARVRYPAISRASFTAAECDAVRDLRGFVTVWTRKEAFIEALGDGLPRPLDSLTGTVDGPAALLDAPGWTLRDVPVPPGYLAAPAVEGEAASVRVLPWSPSQGVSRGHQPRTARR
jgi:phosphopantetheinyl transferase